MVPSTVTAPAAGLAKAKTMAARRKATTPPNGKSEQCVTRLHLHSAELEHPDVVSILFCLGSEFPQAIIGRRKRGHISCSPCFQWVTFLVNWGKSY
jgi:hypothetical protein